MWTPMWIHHVSNNYFYIEIIPIIEGGNPACHFLQWKDPSLASPSMAEDRRGQIINIQHRYPTHQRVRQSGLDIDHYYQHVLKDFLHPSENMAVSLGLIAHLGKRLGAINLRLDPFDGTQNVTDFLKDFKRYTEQAGITDNIDDDNSPSSSSPSWCTCRNCQEMERLETNVCCNCQPWNCISRRVEFELLVLDRVVV